MGRAGLGKGGGFMEKLCRPPRFIAHGSVVQDEGLCVIQWLPS